MRLPARALRGVSGPCEPQQLADALRSGDRDLGAGRERCFPFQPDSRPGIHVTSIRESQPSGAGSPTRRDLPSCSFVRAFIVKMVWDIPPRPDLMDRLYCDPVLRRLCGWETARGVLRRCAFPDDALILAVTRPSRSTTNPETAHSMRSPACSRPASRPKTTPTSSTTHPARTAQTLLGKLNTFPITRSRAVSSPLPSCETPNTVALFRTWFPHTVGHSVSRPFPFP